MHIDKLVKPLHDGSNEHEPNAAFIYGSSPMAKAIRAFHWSTTSLGPIESWPPELLTSVNHVLSSRLISCLIWGPDHILIQNDLYNDLLIDKPNSLGRPHPEVWFEVREQAEAIIAECWNSGSGTLLERVPYLLLINGKLTERVCTVSSVPVRSHSRTGLQIGGILQTVVDFTEGVVAERELREREAQLKQSYSELQAIYDGGAVAGALIDAKTFCYLRVNRQLADMLCQSPEQLIGTSVFDLASDVRGLRSQLEAVAAGESLIGVVEEGALCDGSNEFRTWQSNYVPIRNAGGDIIGIAAASVEITNLRRAEAALVQNEKLAAIGRLSSSIAHEINNPVDAAMNLLFLAREQIADDDVKALLDLADDELKRVVDVVNETLRFHKRDSVTEMVLPANLFNSALGPHTRRIRDNRIHVEERNRVARPFECYPGELRQVLTNLVANALDAMMPGGCLFLRSRPATHWSTGESGIALTVADSGSGMDEKIVSRVSEAFFTTKGVGRTGLGLWIAVQILARHGGHLKIRSSTRATAHGSVLVVFVPAKPVESRPHQSVEAA